MVLYAEEVKGVGGMRYIAELLIGKPLKVVVELLAFGAVIFFGGMFTLVEILDIIFKHKR